MSNPKLHTIYQETILPEIMKEKGYKNMLQVARLTKVVINTGVSASLDKAAVEDAARDVSNIAGQKAIITRAKKSISNFKLREGMPIGAKVTLRGARMWDFAYRCLNIALPNIRDFRGVSNKLDGSGNFTLGITDHTIFPEISTDGNKRNMGMDITFVTSATNDVDGHDLLNRLGMPFRKNLSAEESTENQAA
jgi:large subunit ribosomal protein L5